MLRASTAAGAAAARTARRQGRRGGVPRAVRFGAPFVLFLVGGMYALGSVVDLKYERQDKQVKSQSERAYELQEEHQVRLMGGACASISAAHRRPPTLAQKMMARLELNSYDLKPIPRPD